MRCRLSWSFLISVAVASVLYDATDTLAFALVPFAGRADFFFNYCCPHLELNSQKNSLWKKDSKTRTHQPHRICLAASKDIDDNGRGKSNLVAASLLRGFWKGITLPFPALRKVFLDTDKQKNMKIGLRFRESLIGVLLYLLMGVLAYHTVLEKWPIVDSLYFTTVCFTTVGFGDICPTNNASKIFTCLFGLGGIAFLGAAIATLSAGFVEAESSIAKAAKTQSKKRLMRVFENMPHVLEPFRRKSKKDQAIHFKEAKAKVMRSLHVPHWLTEIKDSIIKALPSLFIILGGGAVIYMLNGGTGTWIDAIYFSLVTGTQ